MSHQTPRMMKPKVSSCLRLASVLHGICSCADMQLIKVSAGSTCGSGAQVVPRKKNTTCGDPASVLQLAARLCYPLTGTPTPHLLLWCCCCPLRCDAELHYDVLVSNTDRHKAVSVILHVDGLPAKPPDIQCRAAAAPFTPLQSVQPVPIPAQSAVVCSLAVDRGYGTSSVALAATNQHGHLLQELQLELEPATEQPTHGREDSIAGSSIPSACRLHAYA